MHYKRWFIGCLGLGVGAWLSGCDGGGGGTPAVAGGSSQMTPSGAAGAAPRGGAGSGQPSSTGQQGTAGTGGGSRGNRCAERANTFVFEGFNCSYGCREGFADCDDSRENGCETDLSAPDACTRCGLAYSCLMPELCGASERECSAGRVSVISISRSSGLPLGLGGFAADDAGEHVMTLQGATFSSTNRTIDISPGIAFRHTKEKIGTHLWTSQTVEGIGSPPRVERFGDQLIFFGTGDKEVVIASTGIDGAQRWSARLPVSQYASAKDVILDAEGNLYVWIFVSSGYLTIDGKRYESSPTQDMNLLVSYTPDGTLRWATPNELPDEVWSNASEEWKDLVVMGDRIGVLRRGVYTLFSRADGSYQGKRDMQNTFASFADGSAFISADAAGNSYIAAISNAEATPNETPMPDSVPTGVDKLPDAYHAHVTKLDATTGSVLWRRSLLWGKYYSDSDDPGPSDPGMHIDGFAVAADGFSWVVISTEHDDDTRRQFLLGIASDGQIAVAHLLDLAQDVRFLRVASDGSPTLCGTYEDWQVGDTSFDGPGVFVERPTYEALAE